MTGGQKKNWKNFTLEDWSNAVFCETCGLPLIPLEPDKNGMGEYICIHCTRCASLLLRCKQLDYDLVEVLRRNDVMKAGLVKMVNTPSTSSMREIALKTINEINIMIAKELKENDQTRTD